MYNFDNIPAELKKGTDAILDLLEIKKGDAVSVTAVKADAPFIKKDADKVTIGYNKKCEYFRMLSMINSTLVDNEYGETPKQDSLCYMVDQSRNAVLTFDAAKRMVMYLAAMGFDSMMLYTEDTYEMDGEPYFGYMRGKWTKENIKKIVAFADDFGVEVIPCIQTLAHLERMMRWQCYKPLIDCENIMTVGDERVLALIDKMFATAAECYTTRKINIGLDEAHLLGAGKYLDKNGYQTRYEIMNRHLDDVRRIAKKYGFELMMWSDMFFRIAFGGSYYTKTGTIPKEIIDSVPEDITLIYWDYYNDDVEMFTHMLDLHNGFDNKIAFAGGVQRWARVAAINEFSIRVESMHIDKCFEKGVKDIIATGWGDDGSETAVFGIIPSLALYAEKCYKGEFEREWLDTRVEDIFKVPALPFKYMDDMEYHPGFNKYDRGNGSFTKVVLYSDIMSPVYYKHIDKDVCVPYYKDLADKLAPYASNKNFGYIFDALSKICSACSLKAALINDIRDSYDAGDKTRLADIAKNDIPKAVDAVNEVLKAVKTQWLTENRAFGLEVWQIRLGGLKERMLGEADTLLAYVNGDIDHIDELDEPLLFADCRPEGDTADLNIIRERSWKNIVTVNII